MQVISVEELVKYQGENVIVDSFEAVPMSVIEDIRVEIKAMFPPSGDWMYEEGHEVEHTACEVLADVLQIIDRHTKGDTDENRN